MADAIWPPSGKKLVKMWIYL